MILGLLFSNPELFVLWLLSLVVALTVHEFCHAAAARWLGDRTAEDMGRLTLNPLAHLDPLGTVLLLTVGFGWGKPVSVNPWNLRNPRWGNVLVSAAGPLSNLFMVMVFGLAFRFAFTSLQFGPSNLLTTFLADLVVINLVLFAFNLLPIPPLDGSKVLFGFLPPAAAPLVRFLETRGPFLLLGLLLLDNFAQLGLFQQLLLLFGRTVGAVLHLPRELFGY